jgi:hypothetical protein
MTPTAGAKRARCAASIDPETIGLLRQSYCRVICSNMKKERIKRRMYAYRQETKSGFFDHIDRFYDSVRLLLNNFKREVVLCLQK